MLGSSTNKLSPWSLMASPQASLRPVTGRAPGAATLTGSAAPRATSATRPSRAPLTRRARAAVRGLLPCRLSAPCVPLGCAGRWGICANLGPGMHAGLSSGAQSVQAEHCPVFLWPSLLLIPLAHLAHIGVLALLALPSVQVAASRSAMTRRRRRRAGAAASTRPTRSEPVLLLV